MHWANTQIRTKPIKYRSRADNKNSSFRFILVLNQGETAYPELNLVMESLILMNSFPVDLLDYGPFLNGTERKYLLSIPRINRIVFMGYNQQKPVDTTEE